MSKTDNKIKQSTKMQQKNKDYQATQSNLQIAESLSHTGRAHYEAQRLTASQL